MRQLSILAFCALSACMSSPSAQVSKSYSEDNSSALGFVAMQDFGLASQQFQSRPNAELARDFLDLEFRMESGRSNPNFSRFEGPISVKLTGAVPSTAPAEMARVLSRLRAEAGLNINFAQPSSAASITIEFLPRAEMRRIVPLASCFTVPRVQSWAEYKAERASAKVDWTSVIRRENVAIFIPSDAAPQEVRDCLNEETAQSLGPLNDLYRLTDSVFNDDNFNSVLTSFDMLMLRLHYAPELRVGMNEAEAAKHVPAVLARLNPAGNYGSGGFREIEPRAWIAEVERAFGPRSSSGQRIAAAGRMVAIARAQGWRDGRMGFSQFAVGRALASSQPAAAVAALTEAARIYRGLPNSQIHVAHIDMQLSAIALAAGQNDQAIRFADRALPVVKQAQNASLLATVMLIKAEALENTGRSAEARALRLDSQPWARYGFGADSQVRARTQEIATIGARGARG